MKKRSNKNAALIKAPDLPGSGTATVLPDAALSSHASYSYLALADERFEGQEAGYVALAAAALTRVSLRDTRLIGLRAADVRFSDCDLANAEWVESGFNRVEFVECRMTGLKLLEAQFRDTAFNECKANLAQFRFATFKKAVFSGCDLSDADFYGADLTGVLFRDCDLQNADFATAKLIGADLRGCRIDGLKIGLNELQGVIIDSLQAISLLRLLGAVIKEAGDE